MQAKQQDITRRLTISIQGANYKFTYSLPENKRFEPNFNNVKKCSLKLIRDIIERCGKPANIIVTGRFLDENEVICFSEVLKDNSITSLSLNNTGINGKAACALFEKLANNTKLLSLCLDGNEIDTESMKSLAQSLKVNKTIVNISLSDNPHITSACVCKLGKAITAHPSLKHLNITSLTEFDQIFLAQKIVENPDVRQGMSSNTPPRQFSVWKLFTKPATPAAEAIALVDMQRH